MIQNGKTVSNHKNGLKLKESNQCFPMFGENLLHSGDFSFDDETKMKCISNHFKQIMLLLGLNLSDESLKGTPDRVAKLFVKEVFSGLNPYAQMI